jgi:hypothetical protein
METNLNVKVTLDLTTEVTLAELKSFVRLAEVTGMNENDKFIFEMNENDELSGYSIYVDPNWIKTES